MHEYHFESFTNILYAIAGLLLYLYPLWRWNVYQVSKRRSFVESDIIIIG